MMDRITSVVTEHSRIVIAVMLVLTVAVGAGAGQIEQSSSLSQFESDTTAAQKQAYIGEHFSTDENTSTVQVIVRDGNVLSKESLLRSLRFQQELYANETVNRTLDHAGDRAPVVGVANLVAAGALRQEQAARLQQNATALRELQSEVNRTRSLLQSAFERLGTDRSADPRAAFERVRDRAPVELDEGDYRTFNDTVRQVRGAASRADARQAVAAGIQEILRAEYRTLQQRSDALESRRQRLENATGMPPLSAQVAKLESMSPSAVEETVAAVLSDDGGATSQQALQLMPSGYDPGSTSADARMLFVTQRQEDQAQVQTGMGIPPRILDAQLAIQDLGERASDGDEYVTFGFGVISQEIDRSMSDSLAIVGPMALLFVLVALLIAYRDVLDIVLGFAGIFLVLVWTFGFMGWAGITFNQIMIAVPVLLIGLSIDYAIHIFMRHREERASEDAPDTVRGSMQVALVGVGLALVWVTATTVIGFMSNVVSPLPPIRDFGIVSSFGIVATLAIFGALIPALKVELDALLEGRFGVDRRKRAFGTGGGRFGRVLAVGATAARKAPVAVIVLAVLVSLGGAYGATQVDTSFAQEDFLAEDPPAWMDRLPEPLRPGEYSAKAHLNYVNSNFMTEQSQAEILLEGDVARASVLDELVAAKDRAADKEAVFVGASGEPSIRGPVETMRQVAATNESFNATLTAADTDGDAAPDRNVEAVFDELFAVAPERAGRYVERIDDGEYVALRVRISTKGTASTGAVTSQMREVADSLEAGTSLTVTATGTDIVNEVVQRQLLDTVIQSLLITLVAIFVFLMIGYRLTAGSATLGAITLLPVALSASWILGTMYLVGMPFNVLTGMITSLTIGLGVAYSIHLSERYTLELARRDTVWEAMHRSVTGTGGALLGSAATTVGGFGVLSFAILPALQQFGIITALTIVYAFLAAVFVLPSLLIVWTKYLGPEADFEPAAGGEGDAEAVSD